MDNENSYLDILLQALDPVLGETIPLTAWRRIPPKLGYWLINNTLAYPWFSQLAFAAVVNASSGVVHPDNNIRSIYSLLRYAIPNLYADVASLSPEQALLTYMNDPLEPRVGRDAYTAYIRLQRKTRRYLDETPPAVSERLKSFLLPPLIVSARLEKLAEQKRVDAIRRRKNQTFGLTENLSTLVPLAKRRYQWLLKLENQFQQTVEQFRNGQISLPAVITVQHPEQEEKLSFRLWDKLSWLKAHPAAYGAGTLRRHRRLKDADTQLFLQLEGHIPDGSWFLQAVAVGVIQGSQKLAPKARHYTDKWQLPKKLNTSSPGLLTPGAFGRFLWGTRERATGLPDDSKVIFCVEPLLAAATVGLFVLVSTISTGMRTGELQQVTYDQDCMERGYLPQFDDQTKQWVHGPERTFWRVYPKAGQRRERYFVSSTMLEALLALHDLHLRYHGPIEPIPARPTQEQFSHIRRYPDRYRFVLQWAGLHLSSHSLNNCLTFLLLEHPCRDQAGQPIHITPHLLRHAMAGWLHKEDFSLDQIMGVLKHVNATVTAYYAMLSPDELYRKLGPLLTSLAELVDLDPSVVRSGEQLRNLQEQALKRYGLLRQIPGGHCTTVYPCEVHFKCANCSYYIPDPARRNDIEQMVTTGAEVIQLYHQHGDHLLAEAECIRQRSWQRVLTEMDQIEAHQLMPPQTVADRMRTFPVNDVGPRLMQDSDPIEQLEG